MKTLEITTKIGCPMICKYCPQSLFINRYNKRENNKKIMCFDDFKTMIDKVPLDVRIDFSGMSEPWLNKDCTKMLLYAHNRGHKIGVYTTASGMTIEDVDKIKDVPFQVFMLHLPDIDGNAKIPITEEYKDVLKELKNKDICGLQRMCMGILHQDVAHIFRWVMKSMMHSRAGTLDKIKHSNTTIPTTCNGDSTPEKGVVLPNGEVLSCCMCYDMSAVLGNLLEQSYESLYTSQVYEKLINGLKTGNTLPLCEKCIYAERGIKK